MVIKIIGKSRQIHTSKIDLSILPLKSGHTEARQVDVQCCGEVGEVPVLHHDQQVHHKNEGGQKRP